MLKSLASFALLLAVLAASAQACSFPAANQQTQNLTDVQATNVRRTAVADVQRIIANNPGATATPAATALSRPDCQDAIWWHEARSHIGESRTVQGPVVSTRPGQNATILLQLGQAYPDPTGFIVLAPAAPSLALTGKNVCVAGRITRIEGTPSMEIQDAAKVMIVDRTP